MAIGFPAYCKERKALIVSEDEAKIAAISALEKMHASEIGLHPFALDYKTQGTYLTMGERIYVNITPTEIIIRSECLLITQFIDFGKNKRNIDNFWKEYESFLSK